MPVSSIQTFFHPRQKRQFHGSGDGFTQDEVDHALHPVHYQWTPTRCYAKLSIADVFTGAVNAELTGRIVNFNTSQENDWVSLAVKDDTAMLGIQLLCNDATELIRHGMLITVYVTLISSNPWSNMPRVPAVSKYARVVPGPASPSFIMFHKDPTPEQKQLCRLPLYYDPLAPQPMEGLMTLKSYLDTGFDGVSGARIMVCVRSIAARRTVTARKTGKDVDLVKVSIFDDTAETALNLWAEQTISAGDWAVGETVLLLTDPACSSSKFRWPPGSPRREVKFGSRTVVDVDPDCQDAAWLRKMARAAIKREKVYIAFPQGAWDMEAATCAEMRTLYRIAEVDEEARRPHSDNFTGKLCVVILSMNLVELHRRGRLCCQECCGIPLYANKADGTCKHCKSSLQMGLNPKVIGPLADESGTIEAGKLVWSDQALNQLFFSLPRATGSAAGSELEAAKGHHHREQQDGDGSEAEREKDDFFFADDDVASALCWELLTFWTAADLREKEEQLFGARLTLAFGWAKDFERLCVLGVEW